MANPQVENGYVRIATEIIEALARVNIPSGTRRIIDVVLRKTYGFNKKEDQISIDQFREATGLSRRTIIYSIQEAEAKKLLFVKRKVTAGFNFPNAYQFNKDYEMWVVQRTAPQAQKNRQDAKVSSAKLRNVHENSMSSAKRRKRVVQNSEKNGKSFAPTIDNTKDSNTKDREHVADAPHKLTPKEQAKMFFEGVLALVKDKADPSAEWLRTLLSAMAEQNGGKVSKQALWQEIRNFCSYWTELNGTGTREKWQMQKTFEVDRRLATWFRRAGFSEFSSTSFAKKSKGKEIIGLEDEE